MAKLIGILTMSVVAMLYVLIFGLLAIVLIGVGMTTISRRRKDPERKEGHTTHGDACRRNRKAKRAQCA
jgi:hypothetical protein